MQQGLPLQQEYLLYTEAGVNHAVKDIPAELC